MGQARQTVERLQLGLTLQRLRLNAGLAQQEAADAIGRSAGRLSQVENGKGALGPDELVRLLDLYDVTPEDRATVLSLGKASRRRQPRAGYLDTLPDSYLRFTDMLTAAKRIGWYETGLMPGVVQSEAYVRALIGAGSTVWSEAEMAERIGFRLESQRRVLEVGEAERIDIVFTEETLLRVVGDESVMSQQVVHLLGLLDQHAGLSIRIVPLEAGNHPLLGGNMVSLEFENASPVTFASAIWGPSLYFDQPDDTVPMRQLFAAVQDIALSPQDSRGALIRFLARST
ncbi:helix-turn-helix transcriptional regulator [Lentzea sp. BCCO 10_0061]|uniref:Helix-turn-helix transcriptional regulator n=1 Tax=Lentzea sokolovensis TaxID=3095429 RepID=A0ABU4UYC3_9PSEU|nr:helix-turn-helix transcriptional regulator [Lentzea sp. BCCO 10_0061]MDX8144240.1 helix-turn-helix transcriptional regulator [Lentzea sp. BCCO 10_0061]